MLLDDNCIRHDKILALHPLFFPLVCRSEMSRRANIRRSHTPKPLSSLAFVKVRSREWHYGIIRRTKTPQASPYIAKARCLYIFDEAHYRHTRVFISHQTTLQKYFGESITQISTNFLLEQLLSLVLLCTIR